MERTLLDFRATERSPVLFTRVRIVSTSPVVDVSVSMVHFGTVALQHFPGGLYAFPLIAGVPFGMVRLWSYLGYFYVF